VYPGAVESIVREYDAVDEFQIRLWRTEELRDEISVRLEIKPGREREWPALQESLARELASAHEGLRFNVELAEYSSLPRFELKARRLVDERPVAEYASPTVTR
jgi:phenylacetate-CoA ligase